MYSSQTAGLQTNSKIQNTQTYRENNKKNTKYKNKCILSTVLIVVYLHANTFIRNQTRPHLPLPSQLWLVLIYRPRRDGRLSRPRCEVAPAEIRTCKLPIASPDHTGVYELKEPDYEIGRRSSRWTITTGLFTFSAYNTLHSQPAIVLGSDSHLHDIIYVRFNYINIYTLNWQILIVCMPILLYALQLRPCNYQQLLEAFVVKKNLYLYQPLLPAPTSMFYPVHVWLCLAVSSI